MSDTLDDLAVLAPAPATDRRRLRLPWHLRLLEAATAYLPVLLMGALALGTWWLVNVSPAPEAERAPMPPRHEPDYTMQRFTVQRFAADGRLRVQIDGAELRHYPDTDTLEIDSPRIRAFGPDGQVTLASAIRALANGDGSEVQLFGDARVETIDSSWQPVTMTSEFLHLYTVAERVRTGKPVVLQRGGGVWRAGSLTYDHASGQAEFGAPVRVVLPARAP